MRGSLAMSRRCLHKQSYQFYTRPAFNFPVDGLPAGITTCSHTHYTPHSHSHSRSHSPLTLDGAPWRHFHQFGMQSMSKSKTQSDEASLSATITSRVPRSTGCLKYSSHCLSRSGQRNMLRSNSIYVNTSPPQTGTF